MHALQKNLLLSRDREGSLKAVSIVVCDEIESVNQVRTPVIPAKPVNVKKSKKWSIGRIE
jgi:hypothetical protein